MQVPNTIHWVAPYVGIPYLAGGADKRGIDCWRLAALVLKERFQIEVPLFLELEYHSRKDALAIGQFVKEYAKSWKEIPIQEARAGDGMILRLLGQPLHIGLVACPGWILHVEEGVHSVVEKYTTPMWKDRIIGVYRHDSMLARTR